jgi:hypothetical protein
VLFNHTGAMWTPTGQAAPSPLEVLTSGMQPLLIGAWLLLVVIATLAAVVPANRAARLEVVVSSNLGAARFERGSFPHRLSSIVQLTLYL